MRQIGLQKQFQETGEQNPYRKLIFDIIKELKNEHLEKSMQLSGLQRQATSDIPADKKDFKEKYNEFIDKAESILNIDDDTKAAFKKRFQEQFNNALKAFDGHERKFETNSSEITSKPPTIPYKESIKPPTPQTIILTTPQVPVMEFDKKIAELYLKEQIAEAAEPALIISGHITRNAQSETIKNNIDVISNSITNAEEGFFKTLLDMSDGEYDKKYNRKETIVKYNQIQNELNEAQEILNEDKREFRESKRFAAERIELLKELKAEASRLETLEPITYEELDKFFEDTKKLEERLKNLKDISGNSEIATIGQIDKLLEKYSKEQTLLDGASETKNKEFIDRQEDLDSRQTNYNADRAKLNEKHSKLDAALIEIGRRLIIDNVESISANDLKGLSQASGITFSEEKIKELNDAFQTK